MKHSMKPWRPIDKGYSSDWDTPALFVNLPILGVMVLATFVVSATVPGFAYILSTGLPVLLMFVNTVLAYTHEEKPLLRSERREWREFLSLPNDVRAKIPLTVDDFIKICEDEENESRFRRQIKELTDQVAIRKREEARLDPTAVTLWNGIRAAIEDEKKYTQEIKKVMGDPVEKPVGEKIDLPYRRTNVPKILTERKFW